MKSGDDDMEMSETNQPNPTFTVVNNARDSLRFPSLSSRFGLGTSDANPMQASPTSPKKRVTSGEFHMNYLGYESSDLPSSGQVVSDPSKIKLDQDGRASDVVVDPFRSTFPGQRGYVTDSQTI